MHSPAPSVVQRDLFISGEGGCHTYRIPSLIATPSGALLAFCEGRRGGRGDSGDIDLILRRSPDGGRTWEPPRTVWDDGANTCGNPCPVVDRDTGVVWMLMTHNQGDDDEAKLAAGTSRGRRTVWICSSSDDGRTWSPPLQLGPEVMPPHWRWYATGPGAGIQLLSGRLLIPCDHKRPGGHARPAPGDHFSHTIYSDNHGQSWHLGGSAGPGANECEAVELADGRVMLNMRSYRGENCRLVSLSTDGGASWSPAEPDRALIEPVCQASIRRLSPPGSARSLILFANPASRTRDHLTVRLSCDEARTWPVSRVLWEGPAAYSCLCALPGGRIGCLYERGDQTPYERITLAEFEMSCLR